MLRLKQDGLFGWAKSALISGIKGVWGGKQKDTPGNGKKAEQAQVSATQAPLEGQATVNPALILSATKDIYYTLSK